MKEPDANQPKRYPDRRRPAHPPPILRINRPTMLFVTVCLSTRIDLLANDAAHAALRWAWTQAHHWLVGRYLIMPDHVHLFCVPGVDAPTPIRQWAEYWKHQTSRRAPVVRGRWQRDCWDTQMRDQNQYDEKLAYVLENPVRAGLVSPAEEWPYMGRMHDIVW